jgi:hypothetical protein
MLSDASLNSQKENNKDSYDIVRISHQKPYGTGSEIRDPETFIPDPGGKKAQDLGPESLFFPLLYT